MTREPTSGPWKWDAGDDAHTGSIYAEPINGHAYAVAMRPRYATDEQWAADAPVLAAAKDVLEALKLARLSVQEAWDGFGDPDREGAALRVIDAAIAKAEGK